MMWLIDPQNYQFSVHATAVFLTALIIMGGGMWVLAKEPA